MEPRNAEEVLAELIERTARAAEDRREISSYEYQMIHAMDDYLVFLRDWPRGEDFDAEVVRMSRTVEAFLGADDAALDDAVDAHIAELDREGEEIARAAEQDAEERYADSR